MSDQLRRRSQISAMDGILVLSYFNRLIRQPSAEMPTPQPTQAV
jgi:hypothetical protein